ncbi:hypothetical protein LTR56_018250 [Elasticomyces elasticus]|nr:hypothetical protein LTR56_018250 [Elasticomyces elasticus]KAK3658583.1 hypothetical protein LTR22_008936 [Elasticomyces elasticus]KAK4906782.1 hypothetical protein LTR49_024110 [Elasticomyces elasticus]KAK5766957.1 hypothetical protein LTS12_002721 [Elasticomyces elasticus]
MANIKEDASGILWINWDAELEDLATRLLKAHEHILQPAQVALLRRHLSPTFQMLDSTAHCGPLPMSHSREEHIAGSQAMREADPNLTVKPFNATAEVDHDSKHAIVWATIGGSGISEKCIFTRESVVKMFFCYDVERAVWLWEKCLWVLHRQSTDDNPSITNVLCLLEVNLPHAEFLALQHRDDNVRPARCGIAAE